MCCLQATPDAETEKMRSIPKQLAFTMKFVLKHPRGNECFSGFSMILLVQSLFRHEVKRISGLTHLILPSLLGLHLRTGTVPSNTETFGVDYLISAIFRCVLFPIFSPR